MRSLFLFLSLSLMTQLCWTQSSITLENEDAQLVLQKLRMGDYYEEMFHLNTEHIAVLEQKIENLSQINQNLTQINENLHSSILISEKEIRALEKRYKEKEKDWKQKKLKSAVVFGLVGLTVGALLMAGAL